MMPIEPCRRCGSWNLYPDIHADAAVCTDGWGCHTCEGHAHDDTSPATDDLVAELRKRLKEAQDHALRLEYAAELRFPVQELLRRWWWLPFREVRYAREVMDRLIANWGDFWEYR